MYPFLFSNLGSIKDFETGEFCNKDEIFEKIKRKIIFFQNSGVKEKNKVLLLHGNNIDFFVDIFALWQLNVSVVCHDENIGIIGLGRIGRLIAKYAMSFGMNVLYTDNKNIYCSKKYKKKSLQLILKQAEFIFLCASYDGKCILDSSVLKSINKPINTLINVSRGELIDEEALSKIIKRKLILKYFTDVLDSDSIWNKKEYKNNPIYKLSKFYNNRIFITPHIGGYSQEAILETRNHVMTKALKVLL